MWGRRHAPGAHGQMAGAAKAVVALVAALSVLVLMLILAAAMAAAAPLTMSMLCMSAGGAMWFVATSDRTTATNAAFEAENR